MRTKLLKIREDVDSTKSGGNAWEVWTVRIGTRCFDIYSNFRLKTAYKYNVRCWTIELDVPDERAIIETLYGKYCSPMRAVLELEMIVGAKR